MSRVSVRSIRAWKPILAGEFAKAHPPPRDFKMRVGQGVHLLVYGDGEYPLHVSLRPAEAGERGWYESRVTLGRYTGDDEVGEAQGAWLGVLRRTIARVERHPGWGQFLRWAADKPGTSLPKVRPDERQTSGSGILIRVHEPCNAACAFCSCIGVMPDYAISMAQIEAELDRGIANGAHGVTFTGGEPTLRRDLPDVLALAKVRGFADVSLQTNAVRLAEQDRVRALRANGLTSALVSLHAHHAAGHDSLLQLEGAFEGAVVGIQNLLDSGAMVRINHVIQRDNMADVADFARFVVERFEGRAQVTWSFVAPIGWTLEHLEVIPSLDDAREPLREALQICRDAEMIFDVPGLCGMPVCQLPEFAANFSEWLDPQAPPSLETRTYFDGCDQCAARSKCSGYWKVYAERHGTEAFKPLRADQLPG
jgi:MoaA/NifB/PqqE/SkfB family radical SAM enzyme